MFILKELWTKEVKAPQVKKATSMSLSYEKS